MIERRLLPAGIAVLVGALILVGLGAWQWQRLGEKTALIETIAARTVRPPVAFPAPDTWGTLDMAALAYQPVTVTGAFDHSREAHVFFSLAKTQAGLSGPGYLIITPLVQADGRVVLINRGFVPADRKAAERRSAGQTAGAVTVTGVIRPPEPRGRFANDDDPARNVYYVRDPVTIAAGLGLGAVAPVIVDQTAPVPAGGLPLPGAIQIDLPNNHLGYALTWWSLAVVLIVIFGLFARSRHR